MECWRRGLRKPALGSGLSGKMQSDLCQGGDPLGWLSCSSGSKCSRSCLGSSWPWPRNHGRNHGKVTDSGTKLPINDSRLCYLAAGCDFRRVF